MKKIENIIGFVLVALLLVIGPKWLGGNYSRLIIGLGFGYALTRGYMGFAGSVNRSYRTGSTKLIRTLALMFLATTVVTTAFTLKDASALNLWIRPINLGLVLGGLLFGFGMTFTSCCATGVLTDLVTGLPRAIITLVFFGGGVFIGMPWAKIEGNTWISKSLFTAGEKNGVFMPDLFKWDGMNGYIGATLLTALFAGLVIFLAKKYESSRKKSDSLFGIRSEHEQLLPTEEKATTYERLFVKPWTMATGAIVIVALFAILSGITKGGWGASTIHGLWFGKVLNIFGASADSLAAYSKMPAKYFSGSFLLHPVAIQNFGIILGTAIYLLTAGIFKKTFLVEIKIKLPEVFLFALGGLSMGIGTRLSNGCNVGALYTPIANFSLSGWLFFGFLILGGIIGNKVGKSDQTSCIN